MKTAEGRTALVHLDEAERFVLEAIIDRGAMLRDVGQTLGMSEARARAFADRSLSKMGQFAEARRMMQSAKGRAVFEKLVAAERFVLEALIGRGATLRDVGQTLGLSETKARALVDRSLSSVGRIVDASKASVFGTDEPTVVLSASFVTLGDEALEGKLVETVGPAWFKIIEIIKREPEAILRIPPRELEELIAAAYSADGYDEVILTPRSADRGRDVIATKKGFGSVRILDQVKAYKPGHVVTADEVRAMVGVISLDRNCSKGVVTTTSTFAPKLLDDPGLAACIPYRIELKAGTELIRWMNGIAAAKDGQ